MLGDSLNLQETVKQRTVVLYRRHAIITGSYDRIIIRMTKEGRRNGGERGKKALVKYI